MALATVLVIVASRRGVADPPACTKCTCREVWALQELGQNGHWEWYIIKDKTKTAASQAYNAVYTDNQNKCESGEPITDTEVELTIFSSDDHVPVCTGTPMQLPIETYTGSVKQTLNKTSQYWCSGD